MSRAAEAQFILGASSRFLAAGATCEVFTAGVRVLRLALGPEASLGLQAAITRALSAAGVPVPEVLELGSLPSGRVFSSAPARRRGRWRGPTGLPSRPFCPPQT